MKIGQTIYVADRKAWRSWLKKNSSSKKEIWLIYFKKHSGMPRIPYNDAVEEALCFGWIDSIAKSIDDNRFAQRFTPRRPGSSISDLNMERIRKMIEKGRMAPAGLKTIENIDLNRKFKIPKDIADALKSSREAWKNFRKFPLHYKRIRVSWIESARERPEMFQRRLKYFIKMTAQNKRFGMMQ
jgi:uncharacterized protein YdeI (YjbR/CyaY-like superfamily)